MLRGLRAALADPGTHSFTGLGSAKGVFSREAGPVQQLFEAAQFIGSMTMRQAALGDLARQCDGEAEAVLKIA